MSRRFVLDTRAARAWCRLVAAREIYRKAGFVKIAEEAHNAWGVDVVGETWEMEL